MVVSTRVRSPRQRPNPGNPAAPARNFFVAVKFTNRPVNSSRLSGFCPIGASPPVGSDRQHAKGLISTLNLAVERGVA
jgi:hypothetical protein